MEQEAQQNLDKINALNNQFLSVMEDYKKYYVYYNKNPEVDEFQSYYANSKGQLQTLSRELFMTTNNIDKNIEDLDLKMSAISLQLNDEKKMNKEMEDLLKNLQNTHNGSEILIDDSKEEYNIQYARNLEIFIGILLVSGLLVKLFKQKIIPSK